MSTYYDREDDDVWRLHRIVRWQQDASVIDPTVKFRIGGTSDSKVPLEEIVI